MQLHNSKERPLAIFYEVLRHYISSIPIIILAVFICCGNHDKPAPQSSSRVDIQNLISASSFDEIFEIVSRIQLATLPECPIGSITDFAIDGQNNFIIADGWKIGQVYCFAHDGRFLRTIGRHGQGPGEYATPVSVAVNPHVGIVVCDYLQNKLVIFDEKYEYQKTIRGNPGFQYFIHINSLGEIFTYSGTVGPANTKEFNTIHKFKDTGEELLSFGPVQPEILKMGYSAVFDGMTIDNKGFIYEKNPLFYQVRKFGPDGILVHSFSRPDKANKIENYSTGKISNGIFFISKGLLVIQRGSSIDIFDDEGNFLKGDLPLRHKVLFATENSLFLEEQQDDEGQGAEQANPVILQAILRH
jgi:sugar lactone lactonase YvrE